MEVPVEVIRPLPERLTKPLSYPPAMGEVITIELLIDRLFEMYDLLDTANEDRDAAKEITTP